MKNECLNLIGNGFYPIKENITKEDLLKEMDFVSERMYSLYELMRHFAGFNVEMIKKSNQLKTSSIFLSDYADKIHKHKKDI